MAESHGYGLGVFTGKAIRKGTEIEPLYNGANGQAGEPLLPFYGAESIYESHPPLREYVWEEDNMPETAVVYPAGLTALFMPGLASIAPCTSTNFNLRILGPGKEDGASESLHAHHSRYQKKNDPYLGAHAPQRNVTYVAARDISPGEELTVECGDDNYDGGAYFLSKYQPDDDAVICLDQNVRVEVSHIQGHGIMAKRALTRNTTILSSPVLPILKDDLITEDIEGIDTNDQQLLTNYCYGHKDSDLLWLPYGPLMSYLNHAPNPNARLQWHDKKAGADAQHARQKHHHPELLTRSTEEVAKTHGKSLTLDVVALRDIEPGEEITIDYGKAWVDAFQRHVKRMHARSLISIPTQLISAEEFNVQQDHHPNGYRTQVEQLHDPYPDNLETFCFYSVESYHSDDHPGRRNLHRHVLQWDDKEEHECFRPCEILERSKDSQNGYRYTVQLLNSDDNRIIDHCILDDHDEVWLDVPHRAVRIVDRPYTTPIFSPDAFRMEIGLPSDMVPQAWYRKKLRRGGSTTFVDKAIGDEFKRKKTVEIKVKGSMITRL
ncbi:Guanylate cyclase [Seminavis robusta]|uniref:Guanylate cyclase n=1 Tax=Seminavis robusta TaxID=568900 RepID=A0A9N8HHQ7_9STRA|nr:Guanylate cyclase [Seminavis robusta]|eukprot:Sro577_g169630.1 Guanylate cyclase (549) ;mRNA; r:12727-14373